MIKPLLPAIVAMLMGLAASQAQTADKPHGRHRPPEDAKVAEPKAPAPAEPPPIADWFGQAVGDILTGADNALSGTPPAQPTR